MNSNPLKSKITKPYARALFDFSVEKNIMHQITADFQNLETFLNENPTVIEYFSNPIVNQKSKRDVLNQILKSQINTETFKFLMVLINCDRIGLLTDVIKNYLELVYETASIKTVQVSTATNFNDSQKTALIQKLKELTNAREIRLIVTVDSNLIGGFLAKTDSKVIDFTVKNQLQQLAKSLDTVLEI